MSTTPVEVSFRTPTRGGVTSAPGATPGGPAKRPTPPRRPRRSGPGWLGRVRIGFGTLNLDDALHYGALVLSTAVAVSAYGLLAPENPNTDTPSAAATTPGAASAAPAGGGTVKDPTGPDGYITRTTAHGLAELDRAFGGYRNGPVIRSISCWDEHAWNPSSDHSKGRGCDIYTSPSGEFAAGEGLARGNDVHAWLATNADRLQVKYLIWQGRIWSPERGDRPYGGGGVYNARSAVGGHYDHIHVSFRR